jgi:hypothetical protein
MKYRLLIVCFAVHLALSLALFFALYGSAAGIQDAGVPAPPGMGMLEIALRFVLLQPLAHWMLEALPIAWWTWPGLAALSALLGLNSAIVAIAIQAGYRRLWGRG